MELSAPETNRLKREQRGTLFNSAPSSVAASIHNRVDKTGIASRCSYRASQAELGHDFFFGVAPALFYSGTDNHEGRWTCPALPVLDYTLYVYPRRPPSKGGA